MGRRGGHSLSAAAKRSPPGVSAPAGAAGTGGHASVTLASADPPLQDFSLGSAQLQTGLGIGAARARRLFELKAFAGVQSSGLFLNTTKVSKFPSRPGAFTLLSNFLPPPQEDIMAG